MSLVADVGVAHTAVGAYVQRAAATVVEGVAYMPLVVLGLRIVPEGVVRCLKAGAVRQVGGQGVGGEGDGARTAVDVVLAFAAYGDGVCGVGGEVVDCVVELFVHRS